MLTSDTTFTPCSVTSDSPCSYGHNVLSSSCWVHVSPGLSKVLFGFYPFFSSVSLWTGCLSQVVSGMFWNSATTVWLLWQCCEILCIGLVHCYCGKTRWTGLIGERRNLKQKDWMIFFQHRTVKPCGNRFTILCTQCHQQICKFRTRKGDGRHRHWVEVRTWNLGKTPAGVHYGMRGRREMVKEMPGFCVLVT